MASKSRKGHQNPHGKSSTSTYKFSDGREVTRTLESIEFDDKDALVEVIIALRNQFSPPSVSLGSTLHVPPNESRLLLAQAYLTSSPGCPHLFQIWDSVYKTSSSSLHPPMDSHRLLVPLLSLLANLLDLLSSQYLYHQHGHAILKALLVPLYTKSLSVYISSSGSSSAELVLVAMKLWVAMAEFAGGREKQKVVEAFGWDNKVIMKLLNMRRRSKSGPQNVLERPDIRTLTLAFLLSPLSPSASVSTTMKRTYVSTSPYVDALSLIWKGLDADHPLLIQFVLERIWEGLWNDKTIPRKDKIALFNERVFTELVKIYNRDEEAEDHILPADVVHHFLLAICTRPGVGVCFQDRGWYPRETEVGIDGVAPDLPEEALGGSDARAKGRGKIYNKILANVLKMLKVNEDARQQELALRILAACPELVAGYWSAASLTLEARLSSRWITNIGFMGSVITLPVPEQAFIMPTASDSLNVATSDRPILYFPSPPPLGNIMENIIPTTLSAKSNITKVLLGGSGVKPLVQHCAALALVKCLEKLERVLNLWKRIEDSLGESTNGSSWLDGDIGDATDGQWTSRRSEILREARKRLPDFQVIQAFARQTEVMPTAADGGASIRKALLSEAAQRLVWMYHRCLPDAVMEAKFDVGKLLGGLDDLSCGVVEDEKDAALKLAIVGRLHVLRLLKEVDQFVLTSKSGSSHTYFRLLMKVYVTTSIPAFRTLLQASLVHLLSQTVVFQANEVELTDSNESKLWLQCLPMTRRAQGAQTADGTPLTDEGESVVSFLDDCFGRCHKKVYGYLEEMHSLVEGERLSFPSPLMMTLLEQLKAKMKHKLLSPSDALAIVSFTRKLVLRLLSRLPDLVFLTVFVDGVDQLFSGSSLVDFALTHKVVASAVKRELDLMRTYLARATGTDLPKVPAVPNDYTSAYLSKLEALPTPSLLTARIQVAYELVDYVRLVDGALETADVGRFVALIETYYRPALKDFIEALEVTTASLWDGLNIRLNYIKLTEYLSFDTVYIHSDSQRLQDPQNQHLLVELLICHSSVSDIKRAMQLIAHCLASPPSSSYAVSLLASILTAASNVLAPPEYLHLKEYLFTNFRSLVDLCTAPTLHDGIQDAINRLVSCLQPESLHDRSVVSEITGYWYSILKLIASEESEDDSSRALGWIRFADPPQVLQLLDFIGDNISDTPKKPTISILQALLANIKNLLAGGMELENELRLRLPQILALRPVLPGFYPLEDILAVAIDASLPLGHDAHDVRHVYPNKHGSTPLTEWAKQAESHWTYRKETLPSELDLKPFLYQTSWSASTVRIICGLLYRHTSPAQVFCNWIKTDNCAHRSTHDFALVLHAFMDSLSSRGEVVPSIQGDVWLPHFARLVKGMVDPNRPSEMRTTCALCVVTLLCSLTAQRSPFVRILTKEVEGLSAGNFASELLVVATQLHKRGNDAFKDIVVAIVTSALQWLVGDLGDDNVTSEGEDIMDTLCSLITSDLKAHLVEPFLTVVSKSISNRPSLALSTALVNAVSLKPVVINRLLQNIVQHAHFSRSCSSPCRDAIIKLLFTLFHLHPSNTCQPTHVEPLVRVYQGSLSVSDQQILSVFGLYEAHRRTSVASLLSAWSSSPDLPSNNAWEAIQSLDPGRVLRSCLAYPRWRRLDCQAIQEPLPHEKQLYDPIFMLLLFAQSQSESPPASTLAWVELFRTNMVCLVIRSLSSKDEKIREMAILQMAALWVSIQNADMHEKPHVVYLLNLLKDTLESPTEQPVRRLPSYSTLILLHALRAIFYPSNFIYPLTSSFLLQRPELDTKDIPMLYGMLYSSSDNWKKERGWIIRFLSDGMMSSDDWRVFKRRHTWDLLASLYQSSENDRALRNGILEVLANLTCNAQATTSLLLKSLLLSWIEMQLPSCGGLEAVAWIKILENIMAVVDPSKIESATAGGWRDSISRCFYTLLSVTGKPPAPNVLHLIAPAVLRLSCLQGPTIRNMPALLELSVDRLTHIQGRAQLPHLAPVKKDPSGSPLPPHRSAGLFELHEPSDDLHSWGEITECLWRVAMTLRNPGSAWDALTPRLLVWRSIVGEEACEVGEWARKEVVANL